ncbi:hypothetical protein QVD17_00759 [Tagetes erecta]|uniref:Uncharacterized protein n=1 Tax=Tagetes erecta TaxID=13708 RepID=A0AAD8P799_TARER|nr:hypothetical protein QVD17_00759 [Tagetes erecta]
MPWYFLEASPWEEAEEEEILKVIPSMGLIAEPILRRLQPVNQTTIVKIFLSATMFATSELSPTMVDLKTSAQEQIEYMLTEDAPLLTADEDIKSKVRQYFKGLLSRFTNTVKSACETGDMYKFQSFLVDMSWACQILAKLELLKNFVENWMDASENLVKAIDNISQSQQVDTLETKLKVIEITSKVLEAIAYGRVILPTVKRLHMVRYWLPFVKSLKSSIDSLTTDENDYLVVKIDGEIWQSLESSFVSIILALPSGEQAKILSEWLANKHI